MNNSVEFTFGEFVDAIEKNGLEQAFGTYFRNVKGDTGLSSKPQGVIGSACAVGQGAINLGILPDGWEYDDVEVDDEIVLVRGYIYEMNDVKQQPLAEIAQWVREQYPNLLGVRISAPAHTYKVNTNDN